MTRQEAINEVYDALREIGQSPLEAAARLYALGVSLDEIAVARKAAGEVVRENLK